MNGFFSYLFCIVGRMQQGVNVGSVRLSIAEREDENKNPFPDEYIIYDNYGIYIESWLGRYRSVCYNKVYKNTSIIHAMNDIHLHRNHRTETMLLGSILLFYKREEPKCQITGNGSERAFSGS